MRYTTAQLCDTVAALRAGDRVWFVLLPNARDSDEPILFLFPFSSDNAQQALRHAVAVRTPEERADARVGTAIINVEGVLLLRGTDFSATDLMSLIEWLDFHAEDHPVLNRLKHTAMILTNEHNEIISVMSNPDLYQLLEDDPFPGGMFETGCRIEALTGPHPCWFWMAEDGPGGKPVMLVRDQEDDPQGVQFFAEVNHLSRRAGHVLRGVTGLMRATENRQLVLSAMSEQADWPSVLAALVNTYVNRWPGFYRLVSAQLYRMRPSPAPMADDAVQPATAITNQLDVLGQLWEGETLVFWLTDNDGTGHPQLLLDQEQRALSQLLQDQTSIGRQIRGDVMLAEDDVVVFSAQNSFANFVEVLGMWVWTHIDTHPALQLLNGARFVQLSEDQSVVDQQDSAAVWAGL